MEVNQGACRFMAVARITERLTESLDMLAEYCDEFLIHAADVEGLCQGIDEELVRSAMTRTTPLSEADQFLSELGEWVSIPTTYAGGAKGVRCLPHTGTWLICLYQLCPTWLSLIGCLKARWI